MKPLALILLSVILSAVAANSQGLPKTPQIKIEQQPDGGSKAQIDSPTTPNAPSQSSTRVPPDHSSGRDGKRDCKGCESTEEGSEFWSPFWGYRLKVTDTLLVAFTFLLFVATFALWLATRRLVKGADKTAESQLRAYISITPKDVLNWRHNTYPIIGISFEIENHGQTIGFEICHSFSMDVLDRLPPKAEMPSPLLQYDQNNSLFPRVSVPVRLLFNRVLTAQEITDIEMGTKRFYTWGIMSYRDAFQQMRTTRFSFSFGGPEFSNSMKKVPDATWNWEHGQHHNDAT